MSEKTLKFNNVKVNKKEFHISKQAIDLDSVDTGKIVVYLLTILALLKMLTILALLA